MRQGGSTIKMLRRVTPGQMTLSNLSKVQTSLLVAAQQDVDRLSQLAGIGKSEAAEALRRALESGALSGGTSVSANAQAAWAIALYSIREKEAAWADLSQAMAIHPAFANYPPEQAWRMLMDQSAWGDGQHQGLRFDNEPGYMAAMMRAMTHMIDVDVHKVPMDHMLYEQLHVLATSGVLSRPALLNIWTAKPGDLKGVLALSALSPQDWVRSLQSLHTEMQQIEATDVYDDPRFSSQVDHMAPERWGAMAKIVAQQILTERHGAVKCDLVLNGALKPGFRKPHQVASFKMNPGQNLTQAGFKELIDAYGPGNVDTHPEDFYCLSNNPVHREPITVAPQWNQQPPFFLQGVSAIKFGHQFRSVEEQQSFLNDRTHEMQRRAHTAFQRYRQHSDESTQTETERLAAITACCQSLERMHLFTDGNARTVGFLSLNKLLLEAGMSPALLADPNHFDGYAQAELMTQIREGQAAFQSVVRGASNGQRPAR